MAFVTGIGTKSKYTGTAIDYWLLVWSFDFQGTWITLHHLHCHYTDVHVSLNCQFAVLWWSENLKNKWAKEHTEHNLKSRSMVWYYKSAWLDLGGTTSFYRGKSALLLPYLTPTPSWVLGFPCQLCKDEKYSCVGSGTAETTYTDQQKIFHSFQAYSQLSCSTAEMFQHCKAAVQ